MQAFGIDAPNVLGDLIVVWMYGLSCRAVTAIRETHYAITYADVVNYACIVYLDNMAIFHPFIMRDIPV